MAAPVRDLVATMYRYNAWASFASVHDTLVHIMAAQWIWLSRWKGTSPPAPLSAGAFPDLTAVRRRWAEIESDTQAFVAAVTEPELQRVVEYRNTEGEPWAYPLWQQMLHQVNHGTQHRSEVAMVLTRLDHSPGLLDFLYFIDVQAAES